MSILRILSMNPTIAKNTQIPKVQGHKGVINVLFKGLDNIFSRLIKQVQPWLIKLENEMVWNSAAKRFNPPSTLNIKGSIRGVLPRYLTVPRVNNYSCNKRDFKEGAQFNVGGLAIGTTKADIRTFATWPLTPLGLSKYVLRLTRAQQGLPAADPNLPFSVEKHVKSHVGKTMLERLQKDSQSYAEKENSGVSCKLKFFQAGEILQYVKNPSGQELAAAVAHVEGLLSALQSVYQQDLQYMQTSIENVVKAANYIPGVTARGDNNNSAPADEPTMLSRLSWALLRVANIEPKLWFEFLVASLLSSKGDEDIKFWNPFLTDTDAQEVLNLTVDSLLHTIRLGHAGRCIIETRDLLGQLKKLQTRKAAEIPPTMAQELELKCDSLANNVAAKRTFIRPGAGSTNDVPLGAFDPRFLVFEFIHNLMLRESQVILVDQLMSKVGGEKGAAVYQLIMGSGKTTVVAPLMALMLADGQSLVIQAVPNALLEFSRSIMYERFASPIVRKAVFTFSFDRFQTVTPAVYQRLVAARNSRAVVVTTPTSIKAFMLKFIELLHVMEKLVTDPKSLPMTTTTQAGYVSLRAQVDVCMKVLGLFSSGCLFMDEVDLISFIVTNYHAYLNKYYTH
jgi:hypothetical protein